MTKEQKKFSVLIVDDDKFLLDMYALKFTEKQFAVDTAFSANDAFTKLSSGDALPDVLLLDIVMPGIDGFELLKMLKEKGFASNVTKIILSNLGQQEDIEKGLSLGAAGYIVKASSTPSEVVARVLDLLSKKN